MVDELKAKTLSQADADIVATAWNAYRGTWSGWLDEADAAAPHSSHTPFATPSARGADY